MNAVYIAIAVVFGIFLICVLFAANSKKKGEKSSGSKKKSKPQDDPDFSKSKKADKKIKKIKKSKKDESVIVPLYPKGEETSVEKEVKAIADKKEEPAKPISVLQDEGISRKSSGYRSPFDSDDLFAPSPRASKTSNPFFSGSKSNFGSIFDPDNPSMEGVSTNPYYMGKSSSNRMAPRPRPMSMPTSMPSASMNQPINNYRSSITRAQTSMPNDDANFFADRASRFEFEKEIKRKQLASERERRMSFGESLIVSDAVSKPVSKTDRRKWL